MTATQTGILVAGGLAIVWIVLGFGAFVLVAIAVAVGALIGRYVDGKLDVSGIVSAVSGRRSSS